MSPAEHIEFSEYLLQNAALYFGKENEIGEVRSLKERIFGVYVVYALYNLQPEDHVCQVPITQVQFDELLSFQKSLAAFKILEPLAAIKNLILKKAFRLTVFQSTYDPVTHKKYLAEEELPNFSRKPIEPFARTKSLLDHNLFGELLCIHKAYTEGKKALGLTNIQMVDKINPVEEIKASLERYQTNFKLTGGHPIEETSTVKVAESAGTSRSALRSRAYAAELKHTRQRRHLDPNMEENFKHLTFGDIAQQCLEESVQKPSTSQRKTKPKRKRKTFDDPIEHIDDDTIAEQVLREEYAARVKPEIPDTTDDIMFGSKIGKQGTSGVAKIRAPKRKNPKLVQIKNESLDEPSTSSNILTLPHNSPEKKPMVRIDVKPRIDPAWAHKMHAWDGQVEAADKQAQKWKNLIKLEEDP
ncbi:hypothetical protein CAEBREN_31625 [Caenorhabditis brenneri]|uniref:Uncharacterized protein n=1 Tax=Caenorhabditis brenneri TaxID=135651 RepID=G0P2D2_CAEBE|nr:hypothetical protein CAEBREN_31625 [Caenorhabditis brenneri]